MWIVGASLFLRAGISAVWPYLFLQQASSAVVMFLVVRQLGVSFTEVGRTIKDVFTMWKAYGIHQYLGNISDFCNQALLPFLLPAMAGPVAFGFFTIAQNIAGSVTLLVDNLFNVRYREVASTGTVTKGHLMSTGLCVFVSVPPVLLLQRWLVSKVYGPAFATVADIVPLLLIGSVFRGLYRPFQTGGRRMGGQEIQVLLVSLVCRLPRSCSSPCSVVWPHGRCMELRLFDGILALPDPLLLFFLSPAFCGRQGTFRNRVKKCAE